MLSNGRVSAKHESHTSFTTLVACTSSLHDGLLMTDLIALILTQFWCCCVTVQFPLVKNSLVHLHSPLKLDARICHNQRCPFSQSRIHTSVQAACLRSAQSTFHRKWSQACTISWLSVSSRCFRSLISFAQIRMP